MASNEEQEFEQLAALEEFEAQDSAPVEESSGPLPAGMESSADMFNRTQLFGETEERSAVEAGVIEGTPFLKDVISGGQALGDVIANKEMGIDQIGEQYQSNKADWDQTINEMEDKHPIAFNAGDIGVGLVTPMMKGMKGAMLFGSLSSVSRLEDRNPYDAVKAIGIGAAFGSAGFQVGKGLTKVASYVGEKIGMIGTKAGGEAIAGADKGLTRQMNKHISKFYNKGNEKSQIEATIEFSQNMMTKKVDGEAFLARGQSFDRTAEKAGILKKKFGKQIGTTLDKLDPESKFSGKDLYGNIRDKLGISARELSDNPDTVAEAVAMDKLLKETFFETVQEGTEKLTKEVPTGVMDKSGKPIFRKVEELVPVMVEKPKEMGLKRLFNLKQDISKSGAATRGFGKQLSGASDKKVLNMAEQIDTARVQAISETIEEFVDQAAEKHAHSLQSAIDVGDDVIAKQIAEQNVLPKDIASFKQLNREWADMNLIEKVSNKAAEGVMDGPVGRLKRLMGVRGLLVSNIQSATGANGAISLVLGAAINEIISDPKTTASIATSMTKVSEAIRIDPNSPYIKRMITAAALGSDALREEIGSIGSEQALLQSSIQRTSDSAMTKSDDILNLLQKNSPEVAQQLRTAIRNQDTVTIAQLMDQASKLPSVKKFIEPGIGWDGKVFSPEDKAHLSKTVKKSDISARQKQELLNNLRDQGTIPVINAEPERFFKFKQRNKQEPSY